MSPSEIEAFTKHFAELFEKLWRERFDPSRPQSSWTDTERARYEADMHRLDEHMDKLDKQWTRLSWLYQTEAKGADQRLQMAHALQKSATAQEHLVPAFDRATEAMLEVKRALAELHTGLEFRERDWHHALSEVNKNLALITQAISTKTELLVRDTIREATGSHALLRHEDGEEHKPSRIAELRGAIREFRDLPTLTKLLLILFAAALAALLHVLPLLGGLVGGH